MVTYFFISKQINGAFEVNKRLVYGMGSIEIGHSAAKKFCAVMNIPTLPTKNNFSKLNRTLCQQYMMLLMTVWSKQEKK